MAIFQFQFQYQTHSVGPPINANAPSGIDWLPKIPDLIASVVPVALTAMAFAAPPPQFEHAPLSPGLMVQAQSFASAPLRVADFPGYCSQPPLQFEHPALSPANMVATPQLPVPPQRVADNQFFAAPPFQFETHPILPALLGFRSDFAAPPFNQSTYAIGYASPPFKVAPSTQPISAALLAFRMDFASGPPRQDYFVNFYAAPPAATRIITGRIGFESRLFWSTVFGYNENLR